MEATAAGAAAPEILGRRTLNKEEKLYVASQWRLMWLAFTRHRLAMIGLIVIGNVALANRKPTAEAEQE